MRILRHKGPNWELNRGPADQDPVCYPLNHHFTPGVLISVTRWLNHHFTPGVLISVTRWLNHHFTPGVLISVTRITRITRISVTRWMEGVDGGGTYLPQV